MCTRARIQTIQFTRIVNNALEDGSPFIDGYDDEVFTEQVNVSRPRSHSLVASVLKAVLREQKCNLIRLFLSYSYLIILLHFLFSLSYFYEN